MSRLYIAEKPSVATEISKILPGPLTRKEGYIETGGGIVTWTYGHILEQAAPEDYSPQYKIWTFETLPILPKEWILNIKSGSAGKQFKIIKDLISKATEIIHAGDPDREGQLLIDEILIYVKNKKPVKRLLTDSLDPKTIKRALENLQDNELFFNMQQSALARSRADWAIGMNLSRAYSLAAQSAGHDVTLPVGRVKTPTLALVVRREEEIAKFKSINYWLIKATFLTPEGRIDTLWKPKEKQVGLDSEGRLVDKQVLEEVLNKIRQAGRIAKISEVTKEKKKKSQCLPFSLSTLQIEAGKIYGYDPDLVLEIAQTLYEKKLTSYPRSECKYLPEFQYDDAPRILGNLRVLANSDIAKWALNANLEIKSPAWNDAKLAAHHAIIPTESICNFEELNEKQQNIYYLVARAYIAQFYPEQLYEHTCIKVSFAEENFVATGNVIIDDGWKSLYRNNADEIKDEQIEKGNDDANEILPAVNEGDSVEYMVSRPDEKKTSAPKRFTKTTLLQAMLEIHKFVKNQELKKQLKDVDGIGTPATRATIIKELADRGFLKTVKKELHPTERAILLVSLLPDALTYPDKTAEWESIFSNMKEGKITLDAFMKEQVVFITDLCNAAGKTKVKEATKHNCPVCSAKLKLIKGKGFDSFWGCSGHPNCKVTFSDDNGKPYMEKCPECKKGYLSRRKGKDGHFWGCNRFPECKTTFPDKKGKPDFKTK